MQASAGGSNDDPANGARQLQRVKQPWACRRPYDDPVAEWMARLRGDRAIAAALREDQAMAAELQVDAQPIS